MNARYVGRLLLAASLSSCCFAIGSARAEEVKVIIDNAKVSVSEVRFKPGEEAALKDRPYRIVRALTDGTLVRTYADGKTETYEWKVGQVREIGPDKISAKNVGQTELVLYSVVPK